MYNSGGGGRGDDNKHKVPLKNKQVAIMFLRICVILFQVKCCNPKNGEKC